MQIAVVGATGLVGRAMLEVLAERGQSPRLFASRRRLATVAGVERPVEVCSAGAFRGADVVLFAAGARVARQWAPKCVAEGAWVIDNSSAFRGDPEVPLIVPEVNARVLERCPRAPQIIANPNCSTIQLVVALAPLARVAGLRRVVVATYQSASGAGQAGVDQLHDERRQPENAGPAGEVFAKRLAGDVLPHCGRFEAGGTTTEEQKIVAESRRLLGAPDLRISATCARVPVERGHSEAVWVETERPLEVAEAQAIWRSAPGVRVLDEPAAAAYPHARLARGNDWVWVGRVRRDPSAEHGLAFWVVADNIRKGAATNAVQILEVLATKLGASDSLHGAAGRQ